MAFETGKHHIYDGGNYTTHVVFYKTYMPPHHLFGYNSKMAQERGTTLQISDLRQLERSELLEALRKEPQVDQTILGKAQVMNDKQVVVFKKDGISYHRYAGFFTMYSFWWQKMLRLILSVHFFNFM